MSNALGTVPPLAFAKALIESAASAERLARQRAKLTVGSGFGG